MLNFFYQFTPLKPYYCSDLTDIVSVMNTDNEERFGLGRATPLHANHDVNQLHTLVDIASSIGEYHAGADRVFGQGGEGAAS